MNLLSRARQLVQYLVALSLVRRYWSSFLTSRPPFFDWRLPVALLESSDRNGEHKFLLAVIVEFDHNVLLSAGKHRAEAIFGVFNLSALREGRFTSHKEGIGASNASTYIVTFWVCFVEPAPSRRLGSHLLRNLYRPAGFHQLNTCTVI
jgi:hypothetical protein